MSREFQLDTGPQATLVFDRQDRLVFSFSSEERTDVALDSVAPSLVAAVLAAEDRYFFHHSGLDVVRVMGAAWANLRAGRVRQGGSTITQQLVRALVLTRERTLARKWREALLALRIERRFDKRQILEAYLNHVYLGDGYYGVEAAARGYFAKSASSLSPTEAALIAGLIKCPSSCSPRLRPERAKARRDAVLEAMVETGALTPEGHSAGVASPIRVAARRHDWLAGERPHAPDEVCALYFLEAVRRQVVSQFGHDKVLRGGMRIYTTLDLEMQKTAERAIAHRLEELDPDHRAAGKKSRLEGSLVALDPRTGEIRALVGGRDFHRSSFDRAIQARRQPGSAFKPLLFAAALELGFAPSSMVADLDTPIVTPQGFWLPSGAHEAPEYTLRRALTVSSNRAAARLLQLVGIPTAQYYARRLGIQSPLPSVPSLALGTAEVSLVELTSAYGVFANGGVLAPHMLIRRVEDRWGELLWQEPKRPYRAVRAGTAFLLSTMLADVMNHGTGSSARRYGFTPPAAGKTGTTDDYTDAWFVGYTPKLATGVWFRYDRRSPIMRRGFAATVALPAWARFMRTATAGDKPDWFTPPAEVEHVAVCRQSGLRATRACLTAASLDGEGVFEDYFLRGTAPYETCSTHGAADDASPHAWGGGRVVRTAPFRGF